ncbi:MAG: pentapeptide repeat-containing protein [Hyphomicrobiaceae bacterium]|nr:pentapeptide repeat-containing protein [Hyphomicrobiaceae bacterium]
MNRIETLELFRKGKEYWNAWAEDMLVKRRQLESSGLWSMVLSTDPRNDQTRSWVNEASIQFSTKEDPFTFTSEVDFNGWIFPWNVDFTRATFDETVNFNNSHFFGAANFRSVTFARSADFKATSFDMFANFTRATFKSTTDFRTMAFGGDAYFTGASFTGAAKFRCATFSGAAFFSSTSFHGAAIFGSAVFSGAADFKSASFELGANFTDASLKAVSDFSNAVFNGTADFCGTALSGDSSFRGVSFNRGAGFRTATFLGAIDFRNISFSGDADFRTSVFSKAVDFSSTMFSGAADFRTTVFKGAADFRRGIFGGAAKFRTATFKGSASFRSASFSGSASFRSTGFSGDTYFRSATFCREADFKSAKFEGDAWFNRASADRDLTVFEKRVNFDQATFNEYVTFEETQFKDLASFAAIHASRGFTLANAKFWRAPDFIQAHFEEAPRLDNVHVEPEGANWRERWSNQSKSFSSGDPDVPARWRALKRLAIQGHDHEREQIFFPMEICSARFASDWYLPRPVNTQAGWRSFFRFWFGVAYGLTSSYGRSAVLPLAWLIGLTYISAAIYFGESRTVEQRRQDWFVSWMFHVTPGLSTEVPCSKLVAGNRKPVDRAMQTGTDVISEAWHLATVNGSVLGGIGGPDSPRRTYGCLYGVVEDKVGNQTPIIPIWVTTWSMIQKSLSLILIFLIGLAVRNMLRMK